MDITAAATALAILQVAITVQRNKEIRKVYRLALHYAGKHRPDGVPDLGIASLALPPSACGCLVRPLMGPESVIIELDKSFPQQISIGKVVVSIILTVCFNATGQLFGVPSGVAAQSFERIKAAISPSPVKKLFGLMLTSIELKKYDPKIGIMF